MHLIGNNDYEIATNNLDYAYYIIKDYNLAEENFKIALKNTIEKEKLAMYNYYMALLKKHTGNLEEYENYLFKSYELYKNDRKVLNEINIWAQDNYFCLKI